MKKLALAIGFAAYVVFGASSGSLAAYRVDNGAGVASNRDSRIWSETATNARLLFLNEAFYPETTVTAGATSLGAHGNQERADMAQATVANARLRFLNEASYPETTVTVGATSPGAHGNQERADMAQPSTASTDTQRMFCEGDICLVP